MEGAIRKRCVVVCLAFASIAALANGQELEPRAYRTIPTGLNFVLFNFSYSSGNVLSDPTSPIQDLDVNLRTSVVAYLRSLAILGRSASFTAAVPHVYLSGSAKLEGEPVSGSRSGPADARFRLTVNILGGPALSLKEFAKYRQRRNLGVSLSVIAPTGQYDSSRLINFGSNRWSFKPELGYSSIRGKWIFEGAIGAWFFTDNTDFAGGAEREQAPVGSFQAHVSYNLKPTLWLALDANYFTGGETTINGGEKQDQQRASRVGLTLSLPLRRRHSLKIAAHTGAYTRVGADFDIITVAYLYQWGGRSKQ